jgi:preprotein translocase YajC subunit
MTHNRTIALMTVLFLALAVPAIAQDDATEVTGSEVLQSAPAVDTPAVTVAADGTEVIGTDVEVVVEVDEDGNPIVAEEEVVEQKGLRQYMPIILIFGVLAIFMFTSSRGRKKQQAKHQDMLSNLAKGDKVVSIGGIVGTIVECREDEITIKTDETNNIRMKFARWAIRGTGEDAKSDPSAKK